MTIAMLQNTVNLARRSAGLGPLRERGANRERKHVLLAHQPMHCVRAGSAKTEKGKAENYGEL